MLKHFASYWILWINYEVVIFFETDAANKFEISLYKKLNEIDLNHGFVIMTLAIKYNYYSIKRNPYDLDN